MTDDTSERHAFALPGTRPQYGPDRRVAVEHIDLHLTPDLERETLEGVCTTTVRALDEPVERISLDAVDLSVSSVELANAAEGARPLQYHARGEKLEVVFDPPIPPGERATFAISYRLTKPRHGLFFIKPTAASPQKAVHAWTQSQDQYARFWFPCVDYPNEKQSTSTTIVVPEGTFALGNGALLDSRTENGRTTYRYRQDVPHSTYLVTMAAGPFVEVELPNAGRNAVPVRYYVLPGREADGERAFAHTSRMIDCFEKRLGVAYPYARYSQIAVSDFIFGGMENTSATTQTDRTLHDETAHLDFSSDPLVSHELAHQWFGDLLTCRDWAHAWLNEGFATFMEAVWLEADLGAEEYEYDIFLCVEAYLREDAERYRRPIVCNTFRDPIEIFDRHLYQKGGAVLHMLRGELGDARFWRAIGQYVERNAQRSVETIDLIRAIEDATGRNLRAFFDQWVFRGGHPDLEVSAAWDPKRKVATATIDQRQSVDAEHPAYAFEVDLAFAPEASPENERRVRARVSRAHETISVPLDFEPKLFRFDPGAFVLGSVTYRLGVDLAVAALQGDPSVVARIRAARELAKDGGLAAREAIAQAFERPAFWGVLAETAAAIGATRAPWALDVLVRALSHEHPKVARAAAAALGNFRDPKAASALLQTGLTHASYFVRAAALTSLGKTGDPRAFDALCAAVAQRTWNAVVESGAVRGLAELAEARVLGPILDAGRPERSSGLRRAATAALARIGSLVEETRTQAVLELERRLDDAEYFVVADAVTGAESLGDPRIVPALHRLAVQAVDGRLRREAAEAVIGIQRGAKVPAAVTSMRDDINELREEQRRIQEKIEALARP